MPPTGPNKLEYAINHVKIYPLGSAINFHGKITIPIIPVI